MSNLYELQRELDAFFNSRAPRRVDPGPDRYKVMVGDNGTPYHEAWELGRYKTKAEAVAAMEAYNASHPGDQPYAWWPDCIV